MAVDADWYHQMRGELVGVVMGKRLSDLDTVKEELIEGKTIQTT
jgi:hypothetical protein